MCTDPLSCINSTLKLKIRHCKPGLPLRGRGGIRAMPTGWIATASVLRCQLLLHRWCFLSFCRQGPRKTNKKQKPKIDHYFWFFFLLCFFRWTLQNAAPRKQTRSLSLCKHPVFELAGRKPIFPSIFFFKKMNENASCGDAAKQNNLDLYRIVTKTKKKHMIKKRTPRLDGWEETTFTLFLLGHGLF